MIFPYLASPTTRPILSLGGALVRHRPVVHVRLFGPKGSRLIDCCLDCASDDTVFPLSLASRLGIDLTGAPYGEAKPVGGVVVTYPLAVVTLRLTDGREVCDWQATVGFADLPMRWALLGHAGFFDFFDVLLKGAHRAVEITPNSAFPGRHSIHSPNRP